MKKSLLALAVLGAFASVASAQSSVTVYGIMDAGIVYDSGIVPAGSNLKMNSGIASASRLGFRGTEDLGGGLSAQFVLESGISINTGAGTQAGLLFGRQSFVGLKSTSWGEANMGRQYTPYYTTMAAADPFNNGMAGKFTNVMASSGVRMDNTLKYSSPNLNGFTGDVAWGFGGVAGNASGSSALGLAGGYAKGPLYVRLAYHKLNNAANTDNAKNTGLAVTYDFGVVKAHGAYAVNKGLATLDTTDLLLGVTVPLGRHKFLASYINKNDKSALNRDANQWAVGYLYSLSKRTDLYTAYGRINNKNGGVLTVGNNTEAGTGDRAINLGVRHTF
jgi:predicted porin